MSVFGIDYESIAGGGGLYSGTMTPNTSSFSDISCVDRDTGKAFTPQMVILYRLVSNAVYTSVWDIENTTFYQTYASNMENTSYYSTWIGSDKFLYLDGTTIKYKAPNAQFASLTRVIAIG